jgi:YVTN family beta-propeller protein
VQRNSIFSRICFASSPLNGVAVNPSGTKVYVPNSWSNNVSVIDTAINTVTATVPVGSHPNGVAFTSDGKKVYVTNAISDGTVDVIDTATNTVTAAVPVGRMPIDVAVK